MVENKKGFTLIELLAVITVLAIIIIIATTSVGGAITNSRNRSLIETMEVGVKNAKSVLATEGTLTAGKLKDSMDFKENQYNFDVDCSFSDYCKLTLKPTDKGKFKNVDFSKLSDAEKTETMFGYSGKNIIAYINKNTGKLVASETDGSKPSDGELVKSDDGGDQSDDGNGGSGGNTGGGTGGASSDDIVDDNDRIGKSTSTCEAPLKKTSYDVGDAIYFCSTVKKDDAYRASEEFYYLKSGNVDGKTKVYLATKLPIGNIGAKAGINYSAQSSAAFYSVTLYASKSAVVYNDIANYLEYYSNYIQEIAGISDVKSQLMSIRDFTDITGEYSSGVTSLHSNKAPWLYPRKDETYLYDLALDFATTSAVIRYNSSYGSDKTILIYETGKTFNNVYIRPVIEIDSDAIFKS